MRRVGNDLVADQERRRRREHREIVALFGARQFPDIVDHGLSEDGAPVGFHQVFPIDLRRAEIDVDLDHRLGEGAVARIGQRADQDGQEAEREGDRGHAVELQTAIRRIPGLATVGHRIGLPDDRRAWRRRESRNAGNIGRGHQYFSRYLRTVRRAIRFRPRVMMNSTRPSAKAASVFGLSNSLSPISKRHDLHRDGGHGVEGVERHRGDQAGRHHHDHRLADRAAERQQHAADDARQRSRQQDLADRFALGRSKREANPRGSRGAPPRRRRRTATR